jgi:hypothetical protein
VKFVVEFYSPLEELSVKRTNQGLKKVLDILDVANLQNGDRAKIRKIIVDEFNEMRRDFLEYFKNTSEEQENG